MKSKKDMKAVHGKGKSTSGGKRGPSALPFKSAAEMKDAQEQVRYYIWRRMEEAKLMHEFVNREEYAFWREEFKEGLVCAYGEKSDLNLVRVYSEGRGIKIDINRSLAEVAPSSETVLGALVDAMSRSFASTYYHAKGILRSSSPDLKKGDFGGDMEF